MDADRAYWPRCVDERQDVLAIDDASLVYAVFSVLRVASLKLLTAPDSRPVAICDAYPQVCLGSPPPGGRRNPGAPGMLRTELKRIGVARVAIGLALAAGASAAALRAALPTTHRTAPPLDVVVGLLGAELTAISIAAVVSIQPGRPWPSVGLLRKASAVTPWLALSGLAATFAGAPDGRLVWGVGAGDVAFAALASASLLALFALAVLLQSAGGHGWVAVSADLVLSAARSDRVHDAAESAILDALPADASARGRTPTETAQSLTLAVETCVGHAREIERLTRIARTLVRATEVVQHDREGLDASRASAIAEAVAGVVEAAQELRDRDPLLASGLLGVLSEVLARGALLGDLPQDLDRRLRRVLFTAVDPDPPRHWIREVREAMPGGLGGRRDALLLFLWRYLDWRGAWRGFTAYVAHEGLTGRKYLGRPGPRRRRAVVPYGPDGLSAPAIVELVAVSLTGPSLPGGKDLVWMPPFDLSRGQAAAMLRRILAGHYSDRSLSGALRGPHRRTQVLRDYPFFSAAERPAPLVVAVALATRSEHVSGVVASLPDGLLAETARWLNVPGDDRGTVSDEVARRLRVLRETAIDERVGGRPPERHGDWSAYSAHAYADRVLSGRPPCRCTERHATMVADLAAAACDKRGAHLALTACDPLWYGGYESDDHAACAAWGRRATRAVNSLVLDGLLCGAFRSVIRAAVYDLPEQLSVTGAGDGFSSLFLDDLRRDAAYFDGRRFTEGDAATYRVVTVLLDEPHDFTPDRLSLATGVGGQDALARAIQRYGDERELWVRTPKGAVVARAHVDPRPPEHDLRFLSYEPFHSMLPPPAATPSEGTA